METLIIGGTRNIGHFLAQAFLESGYQVTLFNRGKTPYELSSEIRRLYGDRRDVISLRETLAGRSFEVVVDTTLYHAQDANNITRLLNGRVGQYIFISTGQVY